MSFIQRNAKKDFLLAVILENTILHHLDSCLFPTIPRLLLHKIGLKGVGRMGIPGHIGAR